MRMITPGGQNGGIFDGVIAAAAARNPPRDYRDDVTFGGHSPRVIKKTVHCVGFPESAEGEGPAHTLCSGCIAHGRCALASAEVLTVRMAA